MCQIAELVENLELRADGAVDVGVDGQGHGAQPALLPHPESLEAVLPQHAPRQRARWAVRRRCLHKVVLGIGEYPALLRRVVGAERLTTPPPREVARGPAREGGGGADHKGLLGCWDACAPEHQPRADRAEVVHAHVLEAAQVEPPAPLLKGLGQRAEKPLDDAVELGHEHRVRAGVQADLREEGEGLGLHAVQLPQRLSG
mmetsp:Transcript_41603/g.129426  ORF Transcript_41603/g.129426 Transcript_41603/m.129426 type:complete len:201 (-) Transcript_41603:232-834(-)